MGSTVVDEQLDFSPLSGELLVQLTNPLNEHFAQHPRRFVGTVVNWEIGDVLETPWPLEFTYQKQCQLLAAIHVCTKQHSDALLALLPTMALLPNECHGLVGCHVVKQPNFIAVENLVLKSQIIPGSVSLNQSATVTWSTLLLLPQMVLNVIL